jgi:hypothetical protein
MNLRINRFWAAALLTSVSALCTANTSFAEISVAPSVEWLSCAAEAIVIGKISKITTAQGPGMVTYEDCVVEVKEVVKGRLDGKELAFTLRRLGDSPTAEPFLKSKEGVLLFLSKSKDHGSEQHLDNKWTPTMVGGEAPIVDLSKPAEKVYSKDMKIVTDPKELLKIVRVWAKSPVKHSLRSEVPTDSPIWSKLYAGSACYLIVPAEEKLRPHFLKLARSRNAYERAQAAGTLWMFPGAETETVLRDLLKDDAESFSYYAQDQIARVEYHVRAAAHHSLKMLGKPAPEMKLERDPTAEEQRKLRKKCWTDSFTTALKAGWSVLSVEDGAAGIFEGREHVIVIVTCRRENERAHFTLVPKQWPADDLPRQEYLGTNGLSSQGARRFYLVGELPGDVKRQVVSYFGLEK